MWQATFFIQNVKVKLSRNCNFSQSEANFSLRILPIEIDFKHFIFTCASRCTSNCCCKLNVFDSYATVSNSRFIHSIIRSFDVGRLSIHFVFVYDGGSCGGYWGQRMHRGVVFRRGVEVRHFILPLVSGLCQHLMNCFSIHFFVFQNIKRGVLKRPLYAKDEYFVSLINYSRWLILCWMVFWSKICFSSVPINLEEVESLMQTRIEVPQVFKAFNCSELIYKQAELFSANSVPSERCTLPKSLNIVVSALFSSENTFSWSKNTSALSQRNWAPKSTFLDLVSVNCL